MCERAGLIAQSIQATSARAVVLALAGKRRDAAREAAEEAAELAERLHYPIGRAAALEAAGRRAPRIRPRGPSCCARRADALGRARPAARRRALRAAGRPGAGVARPGAQPPILVEAAEEIEGLGVLHLAERARALTAT